MPVAGAPPSELRRVPPTMSGVGPICLAAVRIRPKYEMTRDQHSLPLTFSAETRLTWEYEIGDGKLPLGHLLCSERRLVTSGSYLTASSA
eukprot:2732001-Amphidinium_carterae.1